MRLLLEHGHRVGQARYAVPEQFHVVIEAAADHVNVAVDQAGNEATSLAINNVGTRSGRCTNILLAADSKEPAVFYGNRFSERVFAVESCYLGIDDDENSFLHGGHLRRGHQGRSCYAGERLAARQTDHGRLESG